MTPRTRNILITVGVLVFVLACILSCLALSVPQRLLNAGKSFVGIPSVSLSDPAATTAPLDQGEGNVPPAVQSKTCIDRQGTFIPVDWKAYRDNNGGYLIPRDKLTSMAAGQTLLFEGEQKTPGIHDILLVITPDHNFASAVGDPGLRLRSQGSFWRYGAVVVTDPTCGTNFDKADDLLMTFAQDKRTNWETQDGMKGNPITVWLSTGKVTFQPGQPITLTDTQKKMVQANAAVRCPKDAPLEENPLGKPSGDDAVISQIGSSTCRTLVVSGNEAYWFTGARDNVAYQPSVTHVYLIPSAWGESDMAAWVKKNYPNAGALTQK